MATVRLHLSLGAKLIAAFGISVSVTIALAAAAIWGSDSIERTTRRLERSEYRLRTLEQLATKLQKRHTAWTRFVYAGREDARREAAMAGVDARTLVNDLISLNLAEQVAADGPSTAGVRDAAVADNGLVELRTLMARVDQAWWACVAERGTELTERARLLFDEGCDKPLKQEIHPQIEALVRAERRDVEEQGRQVARTVSRVRAGALGASVIAIMVAGVAIVLLRRSVEAVNRLREAESAANETKTMFLANMSHEIRTPLNGILGFTHLLMQQQGDIADAETQGFIATIQSSGNHLLSLINDILDLSKVEAGRIECHFEDYPILPIFQDVVSMLQARADDKAIGLQFIWSGAVPAHVRVDASRLKQILLNLIGNAVKFTEQGGVKVEARVEQRGSDWFLVVDIADSGVGIAPEQLAAVFLPFHQADSSYRRAHEGTGLGLSISQRLAALMGGTIAVESMLGVGTTFSLSVNVGHCAGVEFLEAAPSPQVEQSGQPADSPGVSLTGVKILIVDDVKTNRDLIRIVLAKAGAEVFQAENGAAGIEMAIANQVDLVLMDVQMPVMDGLTATRRLCDLGFAGAVVALTANAMESDRRKCLEVGCSGYLAKPIEPAELIAEVIRQLRIEPAHDRPSELAPR